MKGKEDQRSAKGEDRVERALRRAGPRPVAPELTVARVKASIQAEWEDAVRRGAGRRLRNRALIAAIAASVVLGVFSLWTVRRDGGPIADLAAIARLELLTGDVSIQPPTESSGSGLAAGTWIDSGTNGRVALRMAGNQSVRIEVGTSLRLISSEILLLEQGEVYVDSGLAEASADRTLSVRTRLGEIRDVGTQFAVELDESRMHVRVREGRVGVRQEGTTHDATAGEELTLGPEAEISRRAILPYGPEWDWVGSIAPTPEIHGRPLAQFLDWVTRETGRIVVFADAETATRSADIVLSGSIDGLAPLEALDAVLPTCDLVHRIDAGRFVIDVPRGSESGE